MLTNQTSGVIIWLSHDTNCSNYDVSVTMQLLDPASLTDNAGILFKATSVSVTNNGGQVM